MAEKKFKRQTVQEWRQDEALRRVLNMLPKPHKPIKGKKPKPKPKPKTD